MMTEEKALAKKAIIAGRTRKQFIDELPGMSHAERKEYEAAYDCMLAYQEEICSDNGSTFE